jgi:hypothetical protein
MKSTPGESPKTPSNRKRHSALTSPEMRCLLKRNSRDKRNLKEQNERLRSKICGLLQTDGEDLDTDI